MPCFCTATGARLPMLLPQAGGLSVRAVPPQLSQLAQLLGLEALELSEPRMDEKLNAWLPAMTGDQWIKMQMSAALPALPAVLPPGGGMVMKLMVRLGAVAPMFPLNDLKRLKAELQQAVRSLQAQLMPFRASAQSIPRPQMANMVLAARLTLSLRALGICPMALAKVDMSYAARMNLGDPVSRVNSGISVSARLTSQPLPPFALPLPKVNLAMTMAALAPLADASETFNAPPVSDTNFLKTAMNMLTHLATMPPLPVAIDELMAMASQLAELSVIQEAFGPDAMTPAGIARVNAMLKFMATLNLPPVPLPALAINEKIDMLPPMDAIKAGANAAKSGAATFAAAASLHPPFPPILPLLEALNMLKDSLKNALGEMPLGPCDVCAFPLEL